MEIPRRSLFAIFWGKSPSICYSSPSNQLTSHWVTENKQKIKDHWKSYALTEDINFSEIYLRPGVEISYAI